MTFALLKLTLLLSRVAFVEQKPIYILSHDCRSIDGTGTRRLVFDLNGSVLYSHPRYAQIVDQVFLRYRVQPDIRDANSLPVQSVIYPDNFTCEVYIRAPAKSRIMVRFYSMYIPSKQSNCDENYMYIFDSNTPHYRAMIEAGGEKGLCGDQFPEEPFLTTHSFLTIVFRSTTHSVGTNGGREPGFKLTLTAVRSAVGVGMCDAYSFYCGQLIRARQEEIRRLPRSYLSDRNTLSNKTFTKQPLVTKSVGRAIARSDDPLRARRHAMDFGYCISKTLQCDGIVHCHNARDELPSLRIGTTNLPARLLRVLVGARLIPDDLKNVGCTGYSNGASDLSREQDYSPEKIKQDALISFTDAVKSEPRISKIKKEPTTGSSILVAGCTCIAIFLLLVLLGSFYQWFCQRPLRARPFLLRTSTISHSEWVLPHTQYIYARGRKPNGTPNVKFQRPSYVPESDSNKTDMFGIGVRRSITRSTLTTNLSTFPGFSCQPVDDPCDERQNHGYFVCSNQNLAKTCMPHPKVFPSIRKVEDCETGLLTSRQPIAQMRGCMEQLRNPSTNISLENNRVWTLKVVESNKPNGTDTRDFTTDHLKNQSPISECFKIIDKQLLPTHCTQHRVTSGMLDPRDQAPPPPPPPYPTDGQSLVDGMANQLGVYGQGKPHRAMEAKPVKSYRHNKTQLHTDRKMQSKSFRQNDFRTREKSTENKMNFSAHSRNSWQGGVGKRTIQPRNKAQHTVQMQNPICKERPAKSRPENSRKQICDQPVVARRSRRLDRQIRPTRSMTPNVHRLQSRRSNNITKGVSVQVNQIAFHNKMCKMKSYSTTDLLHITHAVI